MSISMMNSFFPSYANQVFEINPEKVGVILSLYSLFGALISVFTAWLCSWKGKVPILAIGLVLVATGTFGFGFGETTLFFSVMRSIQGIGHSMGTVAGVSLILSNMFNSEAALGLLQLTGGVASVFGSLIGGALFKRFGFKLTFFVLTAFPLVGLCVLILVISCYGKSWAIFDQIKKKDDHTTFPRSMFSTTLCLGCLAAFGAVFILGFLGPTAEPHLKRSISWSSLGIGLIQTVPGGFFILTAVLVDKLSAKIGRKSVICLGCFLLGIALAATGPPPFFIPLIHHVSVSLTIIFASLLIFGVAAALVVVPLIPFVQSTVQGKPEDTSNALASIFQMSLASGGFFGPFLAGFILVNLPQVSEMTCDSAFVKDLGCQSGYPYASLIIGGIMVMISVLLWTFLPNPAKRDDYATLEHSDNEEPGLIVGQDLPSQALNPQYASQKI
jgi:MFS family permease